MARPQQRSIDPRLIILGMVGLIISAVAVMLVTRDDSASASSRSENAHPSAPAFTLASLDGEISLADFRGRYVLLNFWATWCPPCNLEMPDLNAYYQENKARNFTLLAVNVQEDSGTVVKWLREKGFSFPVALDMTGQIYQTYGGNGLPSSFLIGPEGDLVKMWRPGAISRKMLEDDVTPLLRG